MSSYYILVEDEYEGEKSQIGDIMQQVNNALYGATKLKLGIYMGPTSEETSQYFAHQGMEPVFEEIIWKNMTNEEKTQKFSQYVEQIGGVNGDILIIDPYIFCKKPKDEYKTMLQAILTNSQYRSLRVVTDSAHYDEAFFEETKKALGKDIQIVFTEEFHDRFWIANECNGFTPGTSLNGVGNKYSSINVMEKDDVKEIVRIANALT